MVRYFIQSTYLLIMQRETIKKQFLTFILVGSFVAIVQFVIIIALVQYLGVGVVHASSTGFVICTFLNYILSYKITFRSRMKHRKALIQFLAVATVGLLLNGAIVKIGTDVLEIHYLLTQVGAMGVVIIWNFFANRCWTFGSDLHRSA